MKARLRAMWLNVYRIRHLAKRLLHTDLAEDMYGIDETPLHYNEGGGKGIRTLDIAGAEYVQLKQNHAHTRLRVSLMTCVSSNRLVTADARNMPLEMLVKAGTDRAIRVLKPHEESACLLHFRKRGRIGKSMC